MTIMFQDLLILWALYHHARSATAYDIRGLVNDLINEWHIPVYYAPKINVNPQRMYKQLTALKDAGLIENDDIRMGYYSSLEGDKLLLMLGEDWQKWPVRAEYSNGVLSNQVYADEFRRAL